MLGAAQAAAVCTASYPSGSKAHSWLGATLWGRGGNSHSVAHATQLQPNPTHSLVVGACDGEDAFGAEQVWPPVLQQLRQPGIELLHVHPAVCHDADTGDRRVVLVVEV